MADNAIIFSWGGPVVGREDMGMGVFMESIELHKQLQQKGEIERFGVFVNHGGNLDKNAGSLVVEGSEDQIRKLLSRDDYQNIIIKASHVVNNFTYNEAWTGNAIPQRIERLQVARKQLGISK